MSLLWTRKRLSHATNSFSYPSDFYTCSTWRSSSNKINISLGWWHCYRSQVIRACYLYYNMHCQNVKWSNIRRKQDIMMQETIIIFIWVQSYLVSRKVMVLQGYSDSSCPDHVLVFVHQGNFCPILTWLIYWPVRITYVKACSRMFEPWIGRHIWPRQTAAHLTGWCDGMGHRCEKHRHISNCHFHCCVPPRPYCIRHWPIDEQMLDFDLQSIAIFSRICFRCRFSMTLVPQSLNLLYIIKIQVVHYQIWRSPKMVIVPFTKREHETIMCLSWWLPWLTREKYHYV